MILPDYAFYANLIAKIPDGTNAGIIRQELGKLLIRLQTCELAHEKSYK